MRLCLVLVALGAGLASCGSGDETRRADAPPPPARPEDFPKTGAKTILDLRDELGDEGPVLAPSVSQFSPGRNRFGFALFDRARAQIADAPVAIYTAPVGGGKVSGPFLAKYESLDVKARFRSRSVANDPDSAKSIYVAELKLPKPGRYDILGISRLDGRLVAATPTSSGLVVRRKGTVPDVGDPAPRIDTLTEIDVGGDISKIDTRVPPSSMHQQSFADVVGRKPMALLFATPQLCQSRVCGPVVDIAEQVKAERDDDTVFIHQEIFKNNKVDDGFRPQVTAWGLPTEPWLFAIDREGNVAARIEGAFSADELERALDAAAEK